MLDHSPISMLGKYILGYFQHMLPYNFACIYLGIQGDPHRGLIQINDFRKKIHVGHPIL